MENNSLITNEEGIVCRKEILITPLDDNQLANAKTEYDNLVNQKKDVLEKLHQINSLIEEFNGVFDEVKAEEDTSNVESESESENVSESE